MCLARPAAGSPDAGPGHSPDPLRLAVHNGGVNVAKVRTEMGRELARRYPVDADIVVPVPDSGNYAALGFAQELNIPYEHAFVRNHYIGRTFLQPSQLIRDFDVRVKLNLIREAVAGKRVVVVDDSIVRGTTGVCWMPPHPTGERLWRASGLPGGCVREGG